jgi:hypothetical protein
MPKVVLEALILVGSAGLLLTGLWMIVWPDQAVRRFPEEFREDTTPSQARWSARFIGCVFVFFGVVGLLFILEGGIHGPPPEFIGV